METAQIELQAGEAFWRTLAQAFLPPMDAAHAQAFIEDLPSDLGELARDLELDAEAEVQGLREAVRRFAQPLALLLEYSRLFLPPAGMATLNLSRYVDSGLSGPCMDALELAYAAHELQPGKGLRDFADHAGRQFEFMGYLTARDPDAASDFARLCLTGAMPLLAGKLAHSAPASPYTHLARIASRALLRQQQPGDAGIPDKRNRRHDFTAGVWRHCGDCGQPYAREKELAIMTAALHQAGLPSEHLSKCPDCRDRARGFFRREIA